MGSKNVVAGAIKIVVRINFLKRVNRTPATRFTSQQAVHKDRTCLFSRNPKPAVTNILDGRPNYPYPLADLSHANAPRLTRMLQGNQECEERTRKKAEKRKRKKRAGKKGQNEHPAKQAKASSAQKSEASSTSSASSSRDNGDDDVEEFVYIPVADRAASGGDGGAPAAFKNDGSFLEKITAELEAGSNHELKSSSSAVQASGGAAATK